MRRWGTIGLWWQKIDGISYVGFYLLCDIEEETIYWGFGENMKHIFWKYGKDMDKIKLPGIKHWIFGILGSISKWELPFLTRGHVRSHSYATERIETAEKYQQRTHWKLIHYIANLLSGKIISSNISKFTLREYILLYESIFRMY